MEGLRWWTLSSQTVALLGTEAVLAQRMPRRSTLLIQRSLIPMLRKEVTPPFPSFMLCLFDIPSSSLFRFLRFFSQSLSFQITKGGCLYGSGIGNFSIENSEIYDCRALEGGGMFLESAGGAFSVSDSELHGCLASITGGLAFFGGSFSINFFNSFIHDCSSQQVIPFILPLI